MITVFDRRSMNDRSIGRQTKIVKYIESIRKVGKHRDSQTR